jgi:N-acetylglutamate synthase-like GNAT family acetyltransferase
MDVRDWKAADHDACIEIFRSNIPRYFAASEEPAYAAFLQKPDCDYLVVEKAGKVIACGGYYIDRRKRQASMCWGMVHADHQRSGVGTILVIERLERIASTAGVERVRMDTSQYTRDFYQRFGFVIESVKQDEYAPGLDRVDMAMKVDERFRSTLAQLQSLRRKAATE